MIIHNEIIGLLNSRRINIEDEFTDYDLKVATIFAQEAALAIELSKVHDSL